jgi:hypothetical protein
MRDGHGGRGSSFHILVQEKKMVSPGFASFTIKNSAPLAVNSTLFRVIEVIRTK